MKCFSVAKLGITFLIGSLLTVTIMSALLVSGPALADTLSTTRIQITNTSAHEYRPTLGANVVVYTSQDILQGTSAKIFGWMLDDAGEPVDLRIDVSDANGFDTDDRLNDVSGSTVLYTSTGLGVTRLVAYDLGTESRSVIISDAGSVFDARIHGNRVVFVQGDGNSTVVQYVETDNSAIVTTLSGPGASHAAIGSDLIVWTENGSEIWAFNPITQDFGLVEAAGGSNPSTDGGWVVYEYDNGTEVQIVAKQLSLAPNQGAIQVVSTVAVAPRAHGVVWPRNPDIDGDFVAYEAIAAGSSTYDIFLHRLSDGATFQVTNDTVDQELNSIYGDKVAYGDYSSGGMADARSLASCHPARRVTVSRGATQTTTPATGSASPSRTTSTSSPVSGHGSTGGPSSIGCTASGAVSSAAGISSATRVRPRCTSSSASGAGATRSVSRRELHIASTTACRS